PAGGSIGKRHPASPAGDPRSTLVAPAAAAPALATPAAGAPALVASAEAPVAPVQVPVAVCLVTHNSAPDLAGCMAATPAPRPGPAEIALVDSGSDDGSLEEARRTAPHGLSVSLAAHAANIGFAAGMNAAIAATCSPYVLTLNADARPRPDY